MSLRRREWSRWVVGTFSWRRVLISLVEIYVLVMLGGYWISDSLIFQPQPSSYTLKEPDVFRIPVTPREQVAMMGLTNHPGAPVVLYLHGNAEDIGENRDIFEAYAARGFQVYALDYRGYGCSDGKAGTRRAMEDAEAAWRHLVRERGVDPRRLIIHGRSVSAAYAIALAAEHGAAGLVVQSGFVSAFRVLTRYPLFPVDRLRGERWIRRVRCPILFIHGMRDEVIPFWHGQALYEAASAPKEFFWVKEAGHDDIPEVAGEAYWERLRVFGERAALKNH